MQYKNYIHNIFKPTALYIVGIFVFLLLGVDSVNAQVVGDYGTRYNTGISTVWNTASNWVVCTSAGTWTGASTATAVPVSAKNVWIRAGANYLTNVVISCTDLNIASTGALTIAGNNFTSTGTTTISGTATFNNTGGNKTFADVVIAGGTWASSVTETYAIANLILSGSTINGSRTGLFNVSGALNVTTGTTNTLNALTIAVTGSTTVQGTLVFASASGTKTFAAVEISGGGVWTSNATETYPMTNLILAGSTVNGSASGIFTVSGNLAVSASTTNTLNGLNLTVTGTTAIDGSLSFASTTGTKIFTGFTTIGATGSWLNNVVNEAVTFRGGITNNGTFTAGTGVYTFDTNSQALNGILVIPSVTVTGTAVVLSNNGDLTVATALIGTGRLTNSATGTLSIGGTSTITTLTATAVGNTVNYNGAVQTVKATTYCNLTLSGSSAKTTTGTTVTGILSIEGTATVFALPSFGAAATLQYKGSSTQTTGVEFPITFNGTGGVIIDNTNGVTLGAAKTIGTASKLTLTNGILTTTAANLLSVTNNATSAITGGSATAFINGPVSWTLPASLTSATSYIFPMGKATTYLPFSLVNPTTGTGTVSALVEAFNVNGGGTIDATLNSKSNTEYWSLNPTGNFTNSSILVARPTTISPLDVISGSTTLTGLYTTLGGTAGVYGVASSTAIGANHYFALAAKKTIATGTITGSPFCVGATVSIPYTLTGSLNSGNIFTAQLSDASGSFASPVSIGTLTSTVSGTISGTIPLITITGSAYRIRVVSSNPSIIGSDNGSNLTITVLPGAPTTTGGFICIGSTVTVSALGAASGDKYVWYDAATAGTVLKTSTDNTDNTFTTAVLATTTNYWVSIRNAGGCEGSRTQVIACLVLK